MTLDPSTLLRQLGQTGRAGQAAPSTPATGVQAGEFTDLLQRARAGTLSSSKPVSVEGNGTLKLTDDQLNRLSLAADRAEAAGLRNVLVTIDDQRLVLDVQNRSVRAAATPGSGVLEGIDGVVDLAGVLAPAAGQPHIGPPSSLDNGSVARLLSNLNDRAA